MKAPPARASGAVARAPIQARLEVGPSGDHFEREADRVADSVMSASAAPVSIPPTITPLGAQRKAAPPAKKDEEIKPAKPATAQRKAAAAGKKPDEIKPGKNAKAQRKAAATKTDDKRKTGRAQRDAAAGAEGGTAGAAVDAAIQTMRAGPAPGLDGATRSFMEGRFGRDLGGVRVHHGTDAAQAADSLGARAFTTGRDIFFARGQYQPTTGSGRRLLAHELAHTVQQQGAYGTAARKRIQRKKPKDEDQKPTFDPDKPAVTSFESTKLEGAAVDTTNVGDHRGTITLPVLGLPTIAKGLKGTTGELCQPAAAEGREIPAAGKPFTLNPVEARDDDSKAFEIWTAKARETLGKKVEGKVGEMVKAEPEAAKIVENEKPVYYLTFKSKRVADQANIFIGTVEELAQSDAILRPQWSPAGKSLTGRLDMLAADHMLELQIGGADSFENMWLLQSAYNSSVGNRLKTNIENDLRVLLQESKSVAQMPDSEKPQDESEMKRSWVLKFTTVAAGTNFGAATKDFWTKSQIGEGEHLKHLKVMSEADLVKAGLKLKEGQRPTEIKVFPSPAGGRMAKVPVDAEGNVKKKAFLYQNIFVETGKYNHADKLDAADGPLMELNVVVNKMSEKKAGKKREIIEEKRGPIKVNRNPRLGIAGYVSRDSIRSSLSSMEFVPLCPLSFSDMDISPEGELVGTGTVLPTLSLLPETSIPLTLRGDRIMMEFPVPAESLRLGPLQVTESAIGLGVGGDGFFVEGYAAFVLGDLGRGSVTGTVSEEGPVIAGQFALNMDWLDPAQVDVKYDFATETFSGAVTAGVQEGRIPGIESGEVKVGFTNDLVDVAGTLNLGGPLKGTTVSVSYDKSTGLKIGADNIPLPLSSVPAIQNATLSIAATRAAETGAWSFSGAGQATLAVPGATGTIAISYQDGAITFSADAQVAKGPATGTLAFTATNRALDEAGQPVEGPPTDTISVWGKGSVTINFGKILTGTAAVELTPDNRIIVSGEIGLPPVFEVFPRKDYSKDLFTLEPPEFPIWGISVAGIGVGIFAFVNARVFFSAYVGPGEIRDAKVGATMDLDKPEDATVTGHASFHVPAFAGLGLDVGGGLRARAAVAYAEGRVGLTGELGIAADASAAIDIAWSRATGLELGAEVAATAQPKFKLSANASVKIGVDLLFTDVSKTFGPWTKTLGEFGPDMTLGVRMPVRWTEASGLDLSLDNIEIQKPSLDASSLMKSVFKELV